MEVQQELKIWYIVDSKKPWRKIKAVPAQVIGADKISYILWNHLGKQRMNIVGSTAFPYPTGAIASQNFRCHQLLMKFSIWTGPSFMKISFVKEMCEERLLENMKAMRKNYAKQFQDI